MKNVKVSNREILHRIIEALKFSRSHHYSFPTHRFWAQPYFDGAFFLRLHRCVLDRTGKNTGQIRKRTGARIGRHASSSQRARYHLWRRRFGEVLFFSQTHTHTHTSPLNAASAAVASRLVSRTYTPHSFSRRKPFCRQQKPCVCPNNPVRVEETSGKIVIAGEPVSRQPSYSVRYQTVLVCNHSLCITTNRFKYEKPYKP